MVSVKNRRTDDLSTEGTWRLRLSCGKDGWVSALGDSLRPVVTNPWFCSIAAMLVIYTICLLSGTMRFLTNDDASIQDALAGNRTGEPYPFHPFISPLLGMAMCCVYRIFPGHPWWFFYSHALVIVGIVLTGFVLMKVLKAAGLIQPLAFSFVLLFDLTFFIHPVMSLSFTIVPGVLGAGVTGLLALYGMRWSRLSLVGVCAITTIVCGCHRAQCGVVTCAYLCVALFACLLKELDNAGDAVSPEENPARKRRILRSVSHYLPAVVACVTIAFAIPPYNDAVMARESSPDYLAFNTARVRFNDYPHDSYDSNPALFQEIGWDRDLYKLARDWFFMDDAVNLETLEHIEQGSTIQAHPANLEEMGHRTLALIGEKQLISEFVLCAVCFCVCTAVLRLRHDTFGILAFAADVLLTLLLICAQIYMGRALYRSVVIVLFHAVVLMLSIAFWTVDGGGTCGVAKDDSSTKGYVYKCLVVVLLALCPASFAMLWGTVNGKTSRAYAEMTEAACSLRDYLYAHPDNLYVRKPSLVNSVNPFILSAREAPHNYAFWGGAEWKSGLNLRELSIAGVERPNAELFMRDDVYVMSEIEPKIVEDHLDEPDTPLFCLFRHLRDHYGATRIEYVDTVYEGNVYVYKINFD